MTWESVKVEYLFLKKSMVAADEEPVQGIGMIIFMRLSLEYQMLKCKTCQHVGPARAISKWS